MLFSNQPFTTALIWSNLKEYKYSWVWKKQNAVGFLAANKRPLRIIEDILVFCKSSANYYPQGLKYAPRIHARGGVGENYNSCTSNTYYQEYTNYPRNILDFGYDKHRFHPTQKPVALFEYLIRTYTLPGALILDNCLGSGTTAIAAFNTGRHFIGIEKEEKYYNITQARLFEKGFILP